MAKNIVICCDGTNNQFGRVNTNVVRLYQALELTDRAQQVGYYDPGVGTVAEPGAMSHAGKWWSQVLGLAFGRGLTRNLEKAYAFLMDQYDAGDRIYLFGFSRGAYTVRALAGVLHVLGLLHRGQENLVPYVTKLVRAINDLPDDAAENEFWRTCSSFRSTFAASRSSCAVHFLGVWDTVSSVGWVWEPQIFPNTRHNPSVNHVRHAISIDERRCFFRQNTWGSNAGENPRPNPTQVREVWFPGVHADVGGGYPEAEGTLWVAPFAWIVHQARAEGLRLNRERYRNVFKRVPRGSPCWKGKPHDSLIGSWHLAEAFPKRASGLPWVRLGWWRWRTIPPGAIFHASAVARLRCNESRYAPRNFSSRALDRLRQLPAFPATYEYGG